MPLAAEEDRDTRKLYYVDVGLLLAQEGLGTPESIPLDGERLVNEGVLAEQFVAQELIAAGPGRERPRLHYWLRDQKAINAEVDFVLSHGRQVFPLEVKAGPSGQLKSLWEFSKARLPVVAMRLDAGLPSVQKHTIAVNGKKPWAVSLVTVPLYMASEMPRILAAIG